MHGILKLFKSIWLGVTLILLASGLLLLSDIGRRQGGGRRSTAKSLPRLAVMQWASTSLLDHTVEGIVVGLRQQGFVHGRTADIRFLNASGDNTTGNVMARDLAGGAYDMILTASTLALQAVAKANSAGRVVHVFGGVTDPYGAGVGITGSKPDQHPRHLVGVGTFQPVERAIRIARLMNPRLSKIGVVWNPGESNSEACLGKARAICKELGISLLEANAGNTSEVSEAVRSVLARGVEAVWVGGDTVAISAISTIVSAARTSKIPVFSNDPSDAARGVLFGVGASYHDVGIAVGEIAGKILKGKKPETFSVENLVPELLSVNETLAAEFKAWSVPEEIRAQSKAVAVTRAPDSVSRSQPEPGRTYKVGLLYFGPHPMFNVAIEGILETLRDAGFIEGGNLMIQRMHPNNDMSMLPQVARQLASQNLDLLIPLSTPCLGAVLNGNSRTPVVFGAVSAPLEAGAGKTFRDHLTNVTGAVWTAPNPALFRWLKELYPACTNVGVIYNPSDANSMREKEVARSLLAGCGMRLIERTISNSSDISQAIQLMSGAGVDAIFGMSDNTVVSAFTALDQVCRKEHIPLLADDNSLMGSGALYSCGASPKGEGRHTGQISARVLLGENPATIPFLPSIEMETTVDLATAANLGLTLPVALLKEAGIYHHPSARFGRPFRIAVVNLVHNALLESAEQGVVRGLREAGFAEKVDFTIKYSNAQGEIAQLPAILDAARADSPDIIITVTTPALMSAVRRITDIPIVFTVASDPSVLGLFNAADRPANITGVHDDPPVKRLLDMACKQDPALTIVGIIYDPAQPNSIISVEKLRKACKETGVTLCESTASTVSELTAATQAVIQRRAGAILLSADNLVTTGFPAIYVAAKSAGIPVYVTSPELVKQGAFGAVGDNYEAWGAQSGRLAAKVLAGVPPCELPVETTRTQEVIEPGSRTNNVPKTLSTGRDRPWEIRMIRYNDAQFSEDTRRGIMDGFKREGLQEGNDFNVRCLNAQGDMTTLTSIMTAVRSEQPDLIMPISTPALQATLRQAGSMPIVFSCVGDGVRAGAGVSETNHSPNVTGITTRSPFTAMARLIKESVPGVTTVGTLFTPAEINSELYREWFADALNKEGLKLIAVPVTTSAEVTEAMTVLLRNNIQLVGQISDNTTCPAYAQIIKRTNDAKLPFFCFDSIGIR
ncbi:MAG: ABC transporter substrate-binding protein, partial [bacterium]